MFFWLIKTILLSLVIIGVVHYLYIFFKDNLTQPKIKDLLHHPKQEYEDIYNMIHNPSSSSQVSHEPMVNSGTTDIDTLPKPKAESMKDELSQFLLDNTNELITSQNEGEYNNFSFNM